MDLERSGLRDEGYINRRMTAQSPKLRQPLSGLNGNHLNGFGSPGVHGYGLSGRAKVGSHDGTSMGNVDSGHARLRSLHLYLAFLSTFTNNFYSCSPDWTLRRYWNKLRSFEFPY